MSPKWYSSIKRLRSTGAVDALDASVGGKLPHDEPDVVRQFRNIFCVPGYHVFVVRVFSSQIFIVEITRRVDDGTDAIMFFYHVEKTGKPFAKALRAAFSYDFNVDDRNQVLFVQVHRACEVLELGFRIHCGTEENDSNRLSGRLYEPRSGCNDKSHRPERRLL